MCMYVCTYTHHSLTSTCLRLTKSVSPYHPWPYLWKTFSSLEQSTVTSDTTSGYFLVGIESRFPLTKLASSSFLSGIQNSGVSGGESSMSSSSIMCAASSDEESFSSWSSSIWPQHLKKKDRSTNRPVRSQVSGPGLRNPVTWDLTWPVFFLEPLDLRPGPDLACPETPDLQVRSRSPVSGTGDNSCEHFPRLYL